MSLSDKLRLIISYKYEIKSHATMQTNPKNEVYIMINVNNKPSESLANDFHKLFVKPDLAHKSRQAKKLKDNPLVIKNCLSFVAYADEQKAKHEKDKTKHFKSALADYAFLTDRENRNNLNAARWLVGQELHHLSDDDFSAFINNLSGNASGLHGIRQELEKALKPAKKTEKTEKTDLDGDDDLIKSQNELLEHWQETSEKQSIENLFDTFLSSLVDNGHSPNDFWDFAMTEQSEKLSAKYQAKIKKVA